jgi:hypothetical protein
VLAIPFDLIRCSWPRPVEHQNGHWLSAPEWDTPAMPCRPQPQWQVVDGELCWMIDWREFFQSGIKAWAPGVSGEMRGFHVLFEIEVRHTGRLLFRDDDGSIVRLNGRVVHEDRSAHTLQTHSLDVQAGDRLQIAQWQLIGGWLWGASYAIAATTNAQADVVAPYLPQVLAKLRQPNGPALKLFTEGAQPVRAVIAVYSLILNGYRPARVLLYGEHQWSAGAREYFARALPFAEVVANSVVLETVRGMGGNQLGEWAQRYWWVMKACVCLLCEPYEFCQIDDDVFILDTLDDALQAFTRADLVYAPDTNHGDAYRRAWLGVATREPLATGCFNAGLYWARSIVDARDIAQRMQRLHPARIPNFVWEQGLIACLYRNRACAMPTQRYFYPLFDGLPGGLFGYDYRGNPCGFASVHFGGLSDKPRDTQCLLLADDILGRGFAALNGTPP